MARRTDPRRAPTSGTAIGLCLAVALAACASSGSDAGSSAGTSPTETSTPSPSVSTSPSASIQDTIEIPPVDGPFDWTIDPANFVRGVDNRYLPLVPGTTNVYEGEAEGDHEVNRVEVLRKTKEILGVPCVVVRDTVETNGELTESTLDWYAQDVDGNVWYFGERTAEYEHGMVASREGSWEAGVDGALPGVIMPGDPRVGLAYTQEHYAGKAEDKGKIFDTGRHITVPNGSYDDVLVTEDWTPLEKNVLERKFYAPDVGVVYETIVRGGDEVIRLVDVKRA